MLILTLLFSLLNFNSISTDSLGPYTSKTYLYLGNSFVTRNNSKIDTLKYTWADNFANGQLVRRYYPAYMLDFERTEKYQYDNENRILMTLTVTKSKLNKSISSDSIVYDYPDAFSYSETKYISDEGIWMNMSKTIGDTTFIDHYIRGEFAFTARQYRDSQYRKHDQIIRPELSEVENIYVYNDKEDLISIIRVEAGDSKVVQTVNYKYDSLGRVIDKETYSGNELWSKEITVYE